jgi:glycerophosphoryl diester phosphodiesterase
LLTLDDVVVVSHDYTLHGYTNATGTIIDMNWDDIKYAQVCLIVILAAIVDWGLINRAAGNSRRSS